MERRVITVENVKFSFYMVKNLTLVLKAKTTISSHCLSLRKNKTSLKLRNLSLHNNCIKKLKSISITRSSSVNNFINSVENKNIKTTNLDKIEPNNYTAVKKLF